MDYAIKSFNQILVTDHQPKYVEWELNLPLENLFKDYKELHIVSHDVFFLDISYFDVLCKIFEEYNYSISAFARCISNPHFIIDSPDYSSQLKDRIYYSRVKHHENLKCNEESALELAKQETHDLSFFINEVIDKNHIIMEDFKSFLLGFAKYVKEIHHQEHSDFHSIYNLLKDEYLFFRNSQIESLKKYNLSIGLYTKRYYESRGKSNDFIPGGLCHYGSNVFINYHFMTRNKIIDLWERKTLLRTFYHEIGHALNYLYYHESIIKNKENVGHMLYTSHNDDFLKCCKLNYRNLKKFKHKIDYRAHNSLNYYCTPKITSLNPSKVYQNTTNNKSLIINSQINDIFNDFIATTLTYQTNEKSLKKFSTKVLNNSIQYEYNRVLEESWAESFSFIFYWFRHDFREYDEYIIKANQSFERVMIKSLYHCMIYILYNFDWSKLNIPYHVVLRKRLKIRDFIDYVYQMPLYQKGTKGRQSKTKKYKSLKDIKKNGYFSF